MQLPRLIGMVHLGALPGAPNFGGDLESVTKAAVTDATTLAAAGFDAVMVENFGDAPFFANDVPKLTVAAMTATVTAVRQAIEIPLGINVLRNDALAALDVAAITGAAFIRVNVLGGTMHTDQGPIVGKAAEVARYRAAIAPKVAVLADVFVKHATPPPDLPIEQAAEELIGRAGADAIVISGTATGRPPTLPLLRKVRAAVPDSPLYVGSGAAGANVARFLAVASGVIAGTATKQRGITTNPVDGRRARRFVVAAKRRAPP